MRRAALAAISLACALVPVCEGSRAEPQCDDGLECLVEGNEDVVFCLPSCDPLDSGTCTRQETCVPATSGFVCTRHNPEAAPQDDCIFDTCAAGSMCTLDAIPGCDTMPCCIPYCDLAAPACPNDGDECTPFYAPGEAPDGLDDVGVCVPSG